MYFVKPSWVHALVSWECQLTHGLSRVQPVSLLWRPVWRSVHLMSLIESFFPGILYKSKISKPHQVGKYISLFQWNIRFILGFPGGSDGKELPAIQETQEMHVWSRKWQPAPVFLPGKSHGQRSLAGYSSCVCKRVGHDFAIKQQHSAEEGSCERAI